MTRFIPKPHPACFPLIAVLQAMESWVLHEKLDTTNNEKLGAASNRKLGGAWGQAICDKMHKQMFDAKMLLYLS